MRLDSCRQCVRRRIQCDAQIPVCVKCLKKGLPCSGIGKAYRFVCPQTGNSTLEARPDRDMAVPSDQPDAHDLGLSSLDSSTGLGLDAGLEQIDTSAEAIDLVLSCNAFSSEPTCYYRGPAYSLEALHPCVRMLFNHFSTVIAPAMVVHDSSTTNGYRDMILPFATHDNLVQRAVSVISALHLGKKQPELLGAAEKGRSAIIERLRRDALTGSPGEIFNLSTWATIILLLVGETVTGDDEFVYLFTMLQSFHQTHGPALTATEANARTFLQQQTQMFSLFTPPFLGPVIGLAALQNHLIKYHDWIQDSTDHLSPTNSSEILKQSIDLVRELYVLQARNEINQIQIDGMVEQLILLVVQINEQTPGMHAFVWCYFIAGASTSNVGFRTFFEDRLKQVYSRTGMRNILSTIKMLQQIWQSRSVPNWTHSPAALRRTLVM